MCFCFFPGSSDRPAPGSCCGKPWCHLCPHPWRLCTWFTRQGLFICSTKILILFLNDYYSIRIIIMHTNTRFRNLLIKLSDVKKKKNLLHREWVDFVNWKKTITFICGKINAIESNFLSSGRKHCFAWGIMAWIQFMCNATGQSWG